MRRNLLIFGLIALAIAGCKDNKNSAEDAQEPQEVAAAVASSAVKQTPVAQPEPEPEAEPFWLGADISWATEMERYGQKLYDYEGNGPRECTALMKDLGLNAVRLRVWVDPQGWELEQAERRRELLADKPAGRDQEEPAQARSRQRKQKAEASASSALMASAADLSDAAPSEDGTGAEEEADTEEEIGVADEGIGSAAEERPAFNHAGSNDKEDLLEKALRAKKLGMEIMVNFHYSDSWADPKKQPVPLGWKGHSYEQMKLDLRDHTVEVLSYLKQHGVDVKWVQIGNEVTHGLLWSYKTGREAIGPDGKPVLEDDIGRAEVNPGQYAGFIQAGCEAAKSVYPQTITIVHLDNGWDSELYEWNLGILKKYGVDYDMVGMSLYPYWAREERGRDDADGIITDCMKNVKSVYSRFGKESMIVETGFEVNEASETVMMESKRQLLRVLREAQGDTDGHCKGVFYWEPECRPSKYKLGAFSSSGRPTVIMDAYREL